MFLVYPTKGIPLLLLPTNHQEAVKRYKVLYCTVQKDGMVGCKLQLSPVERHQLIMVQKETVQSFKWLMKKTRHGMLDRILSMVGLQELKWLDLQSDQMIFHMVEKSRLETHIKKIWGLGKNKQTLLQSWWQK